MSWESRRAAAVPRRSRRLRPPGRHGPGHRAGSPQAFPPAGRPELSWVTRCIGGVCAESAAAPFRITKISGPVSAATASGLPRNPELTSGGLAGDERAGRRALQREPRAFRHRRLRCGIHIGRVWQLAPRGPAARRAWRRYPPEPARSSATGAFRECRRSARQDSSARFRTADGPICSAPFRTPADRPPPGACHGRTGRTARIGHARPKAARWQRRPAGRPCLSHRPKAGLPPLRHCG